jgi:hypothetical protein
LKDCFCHGDCLHGTPRKHGSEIRIWEIVILNNRESAKERKREKMLRALELFQEFSRALLKGQWRECKSMQARPAAFFRAFALPRFRD